MLALSAYHRVVHFVNCLRRVSIFDPNGCQERSRHMVHVTVLDAYMFMWNAIQMDLLNLPRCITKICLVHWGVNWDHGAVIRVSYLYVILVTITSCLFNLMAVSCHGYTLHAPLHSKPRPYRIHIIIITFIYLAPMDRITSYMLEMTLYGVC